MTDDKLEQLAVLLGELKASGMTAPNIPRPVWEAIAGVAPQPAVEVLLSSGDGEVLLTYRADAHWDGWHIPGGYVGCGESLAQACRRIAERELGIAVELREVVGAYAWPDHPYACAVSILCACEASERPHDGRFFGDIPERIVTHHAAFIETYWAYLERRRRVVEASSVAESLGVAR